MKISIVFSIIMALLLLLSACNTIEGQKDNSETSVAETISEKINLPIRKMCRPTSRKDSAIVRGSGYIA